jgi:hypothetical protein
MDEEEAVEPPMRWLWRTLQEELDPETFRSVKEIFDAKQQAYQKYRKVASQQNRNNIYRKMEQET